jgi:ribonuclease P protein component
MTRRAAGAAPRLGRLRKRAEFLRVAAQGKKAAMPGVIVQSLAAAATQPHLDGQAELWLGITVSRKVGNAVARNRARRRLREAARQVLPRIAASGHDYVLIGRTETLTRPFPLLQADIETALRRLGASR